MSTAALLAPPPRPPHDPLWIELGRSYGWRIAPGVTAVETALGDHALTLRPLPGTGRQLTEPSGSFGGLVLPLHVAIDDECRIWLLDRTGGRLLRFDPCDCAFRAMPCTAGIGDGPRQLRRPGAITAVGELILVSDEGPPGRVLVFDGRSLALRTIWRPPPTALAQPWQPRAIAVATAPSAAKAGRSGPGAVVLVADRANGILHRFNLRGHWLGGIDGFGAVAALAIDCDGRIYSFIDGDAAVRSSAPDGTAIGLAATVAEIAGRFPKLPLPLDAKGRINLSAWCASGGWFDAAGNASGDTPADDPAYPAQGVWTSTMLDSAIARCQWHRIVVEMCVPAHGGIDFFTFTAETNLPDSHVAALPDTAWTAVPPLPATGDALILSQPGRYLWLRAVLRSPGTATPRLNQLLVEYPRISLRRYLPAAFGADPVSADFTDRLLAIFDREFRSVEAKIDDEAALFDPRSAPAGERKGEPDFLTWLASWVGVSLDRSWSLARRRAYLRRAPHLFACQGTLRGVFAALVLYLGLDRPAPPAHRAVCASRCASPPPQWRAPPLILEHWRLRRWLFLGGGRIGDAAMVWGESLLGRSRLDNTAEMGVTRLDTTQDPERDPFHLYAHKFSVFLPARFARNRRDRSAVERLIAAQQPAHTQATIKFVEPRMRIGIQCGLGFDTVVACWPSGVTLGSAELGRATVLSGREPRPPAPRIGRTARLGAAVGGPPQREERR
jgi:phage tail-like protein